MTPEELWRRTVAYVRTQYWNMGQNPSTKELNETVVKVYNQMEFLVKQPETQNEPLSTKGD